MSRRYPERGAKMAVFRLRLPPVPWEALLAAFAESLLAVAVEGPWAVLVDGAVVRVEVAGQVCGHLGVVRLWLQWERRPADVGRGRICTCNPVRTSRASVSVLLCRSKSSR